VTITYLKVTFQKIFHIQIAAGYITGYVEWLRMKEHFNVFY